MNTRGSMTFIYALASFAVMVSVLCDQLAKRQQTAFQSQTQAFQQQFDTQAIEQGLRALEQQRLSEVPELVLEFGVRVSEV